LFFLAYYFREKTWIFLIKLLTFKMICAKIYANMIFGVDEESRAIAQSTESRGW
jgi:hypothetical protein